ncbi:hypothetical protein B9479_002599 [Cryptococcus floricola]|uniref:protein-tyrosine-phosphatase n=1 Tax=Cryptococcus floricola TaxID=2591691 RepID=A0A5D3B299_9TREE|nr:hypothetical protein B9479_002599 [Cryptococcus floricola]
MPNDCTTSTPHPPPPMLAPIPRSVPPPQAAALRTPAPIDPASIAGPSLLDSATYRHAYSPDTSSTASSPTSLPYLRDTPERSPLRMSEAHSPTIPAPNRSSSSLLPHLSSSPSWSSRSSGSDAPLTAPIPYTAPRSPLPRRRPSPLVLGKAKTSMGIDEGLELERSNNGGRQYSSRPATAGSVTSLNDDGALANELESLSLLRKTVRKNLIARPVDSPLAGSGSESGESGFPTPERSYFPSTKGDSLTKLGSIDIKQVLERQATGQMLVVDTRPLGSFLEEHLPRAVSISVPTLISKRFQRSSVGSGSNGGLSWGHLRAFISTTQGRDSWDEADEGKTEIALIKDDTDDAGNTLAGILQSLVDKDRVKEVEGGWEAIKNTPESRRILVAGEVEPAVTDNDPLLPPPKSAPPVETPPLPPVPPSPAPLRVSHRPSLPSLRPPGSNQHLPALSINGGGNSKTIGRSTLGERRTPKLSLNLDRPLRSATLGSFDIPPTPGGFMCSRNKPLRSPGLSLNIPQPNGQSAASPSSLQVLAHEQSKFPPSPSSFGDVKRLEGEDEDLVATGWSNEATPRGRFQISDSPPDSQIPLSSSSSSTTTTRLANPIAPFNVSTILPNFLFLGPDITNDVDVKKLQSLGVKRILNVAIECDDDQGLGLREKFRYHRVPMRDIVEENGVGKGMRDACEFLDDARLHSAPTYIHCQAGRSRSVTITLAYLIHANAWTLKTSYAYVAERRKGISPNIGFVAELMQWEESELGLKVSGGVHGDGGGRKAGPGPAGDGEEKNNRYMRESLPPTWSASFDTYSRPPNLSPANGDGAGAEGDGARDNGQDDERQAVGDEREVRKNGVWVHHRRAPVDRTTLQPGRRVSKAGLESLRPLNTTPINGAGPASDDGQTKDPRPSPRPSPRLGMGGGHAMTPAGDGPLRWI